MIVPLPQDGKDGLSITNIQIDANKHLICTMSDNTVIDAGEIPGGGGLVQKANKSSFPITGSKDTLYLALNEEIIYYWNGNSYKPISGGSGVDGVDLKTGSIEFDDVETTFDLPIDDKEVNVFINGMYLTENEDYTIDRTARPNRITFLETWEPTDICTIVWVKGVINPSGSTQPTIQLPQTIYILSKDITEPWPANISLTSKKIYGISNPTIEQKTAIKFLLVINDDKKIIGCGMVSNYNNSTDIFTIVLTKYSEENGTSIDGSLAKKEDIDKLFSNLGDIDITNSTLAKKEDIDKLFANSPPIDISSSTLATTQDIDNLFLGGTS